MNFGITLAKSMGKKLTVYMIDGTEYGPRFSEIGNWVGKAVYSPRATINKLNSAGFTVTEGELDETAPPRFVTAWNTTENEVDDLLNAIKQAV